VKDKGNTETTLADKAQIAFDTVRSLLARPSGGNVRSLEKLCAALGQPLRLVFRVFRGIAIRFVPAPAPSSENISR
jgi:hypothetical protein